MIGRAGFFLLLVLMIASCSRRFSMVKSSLTYELGDLPVEIIRWESGRVSGNPFFFNMHENERTSIRAAKKYLKQNEGRLVYLQHGKGRNLKFRLGEERFECDPNRIFTEKGIAESLQKFDCYDRRAQQEIWRFSEFLVRAIDLNNQPIVIALHNNTDENYSLLSYLPEAEYEMEADTVHLQQDGDADDFFFVTDTTISDALISTDQNVVLQANEVATDDGSLSIRCAWEGVPYVNVEAQHGHRKKQLEMYRWLIPILRELGFLDAGYL